MGNALSRRIAITILAVLILVYVGYQAFRSSSFSQIKTETAIYGTMWYSIEVDAFAVREEEILTGASEGTVSFNVEDGRRVASGGVLASVFSNENEARAYTALKSLDIKIEALSQLDAMKETYQLSPKLYEEKLKAQLIKLENNMVSGSLIDIPYLKQALLTFMNQKDVATGSATDYQEEIRRLKDEYNSLSEAVPSQMQKIYAPYAGYFISKTDGFETSIDFNNVLNTNADMIEAIDRNKAPENNNAIGRICKDHNWYIVFTVGKDDASEFEQLYKNSDSVYINFPYSAMDKVPAKVAAVNQSEKGAAIVLKCDYMNSRLANFRKEKIEIRLYNYEGVMVGINALDFADVQETVKDENGNESVITHENVQGVYIKNGAVLEFVQIIPKIVVNGYAVCKTVLSEKDVLYTSKTISLYDEVVVSGKDLYDGKRIE